MPDLKPESSESQNWFFWPCAYQSICFRGQGLMGTEPLPPRPNWWHLCPLFIYSQMSTNQGKFRQAGWPPRAQLERKIKVKWKKELSLSSWLWILFRERSAFTLKVRPQISRKCPEWGEGRALWLWGPHDALEGAGRTLSLTCTLCSQLWERPLAKHPKLLALPSASTPILTFGSHSSSPVKVFAIPQTPRTLTFLSLHFLQVSGLSHGFFNQKFQLCFKIQSKCRFLQDILLDSWFWCLCAVLVFCPTSIMALRKC